MALVSNFTVSSLHAHWHILGLNKTVLNTSTDVFTYSQLYTSLSHVRNRADTLLLHTNESHTAPTKSMRSHDDLRIFYGDHVTP
jgi:hypothetical protein